MVIQESRCTFLFSSVYCGSVSKADTAWCELVASSAVYDAPAGGGAGPKSSSLLSESSDGATGGLSLSGAGGRVGPRTRVGFGAGGFGPESLSSLLDRDRD